MKEKMFREGRFQSKSFSLWDVDGNLCRNINYNVCNNKYELLFWNFKFQGELSCGRCCSIKANGTRKYWKVFLWDWKVHSLELFGNEVRIFVVFMKVAVK